ncbi:MAG: ABC transporter substrate-binding protein, partial [Anaerolineae bacterium]
MTQARKADRQASITPKRRSWICYLCAAAVGAALVLAIVGCGGKDSTSNETQTGGSSGVTSTSSGPATSGEPIVIGAIVSATGPNSALGAQERNVLEMMETKINNEGGVLGRPLEIIVEDDKTDAKEAVTAANRLLDQKKAVAIIAATGSASTLAVKPITAERKIPQIAMAAANDITDAPPTEWIWRTPHKDAMAVARALTYISKSLGAKKIAVLHDENA